MMGSGGIEAGIFLPCERSEDTSTGHALGESVKVFGRLVCKLPYLGMLHCFEQLSVGTEFLAGTAGMVVGGLVGTTAILARKCMGAKARKFFGLENPKSLLNYLAQGFHTGARLGELPGKFIGGCGAFAFVAACFLSSEIMVPVVFGTVGVVATVSAVATFGLTKKTGENPLRELTENCIQNTRIRYRCAHNFLQGRNLTE